jgi:uncharacterized protein YndB with AHSA1/START domain
MTDRNITHATFSLERVYQVSTESVFAAWADGGAKARWFAGPGADHEMDFRVGGREVNRSTDEDGKVLTFESVYQDIVPGQRIVYASTLSVGKRAATVSITSVELTPEGEGSRLLLTESGAYLDELEQPTWREQGTGTWLDALAAELQSTGSTSDAPADR